MKYLSILIAGLIIPFFLMSQSVGEIKGKIVDPDDPLGIPGAHVYVEIGGMKQGTTTDNRGLFTIKPLNPGVYNVFVSFMGYKSKMITDVNVKPDKITFMGDIVIESGVFIDSIEVFRFKKKLIDIEEPMKLTMLGPELEKIPDRGNLPLLLRSLSTDVQVSEDGRDIYFRGARSGTSAYIIDGVRCATLSDAIPGNSIGSITIYSGGVPAKYGDFTGGVVVIETKSYFDMLNMRRARQSHASKKN